MASHAIWLCACVSANQTPVWLVYAVGDEGIGWQRLPDGVPASHVVEAEQLTGCHLAPEDVLAWLRGERLHPSDDDTENASIYEELRRRICSA